MCGNQAIHLNNQRIKKLTSETRKYFEITKNKNSILKHMAYSKSSDQREIHSCKRLHKKKKRPKISNLSLPCKDLFSVYSEITQPSMQFRRRYQVSRSDLLHINTFSSLRSSTISKERLRESLGVL